MQRRVHSLEGAACYRQTKIQRTGSTCQEFDAEKTSQIKEFNSTFGESNANIFRDFILIISQLRFLLSKVEIVVKRFQSTISYRLN